MSGKLAGLAGSPGIASGPAYQAAHEVLHAERHQPHDAHSELQKLEAALQRAEADLASLERRALEQVGKEEAAIFQAQSTILRDPELNARVKKSVQEQELNVEFAWQESIKYYAGMLRNVGDEYLAARAADVEDVGQRVLAVLAGRAERSNQLRAPSIIVAEDLTPADTILFDRNHVLGFCTQGGGPTSHVAILSKALGVPCILGLGPKLAAIPDGAFLVMDGGAGELLIDPGPEIRKKYEVMAAGQLALQQQAVRNAALPAATLDGHRVEVVANVGSLADAREAMQNGAEGIGLLRTEFLFLGQATAPSEAEQVSAYAEIFHAIGASRPIVVRTLDIGGDKPATYLDMPQEQNPFLGLRGIRLTLRFQELFEIQLRALLQAGAGYDLRIMFPMVSNPEEILQARSLLDRSRAALLAEGKPNCAEPQVGIMVEVPSAAIMANVLADFVDFFSIGTNDLSQYTVAAERTSADVAYLADGFHPAVLELIRRVIEAAHRKGKWVGLCGELAGDPLATPLLLGLGLDEFSASPKSIPLLKQAIRRLSSEDAPRIAQNALQFASAREVRAYMQAAIKGSAPA